jgi:hypothetical protein
MRQFLYVPYLHVPQEKSVLIAVTWNLWTDFYLFFACPVFTMTQGLTLEELELSLKDAYLMMAMDDVPENYYAKEISL